MLRNSGNTMSVNNLQTNPLLLPLARRRTAAAGLAFAVLAGALWLPVLPAHAQPATVEIAEPWVRATVGGQNATGAFMSLKSSAAQRLVQVSSPVAGVVEIHEMAMEKDVMRMRAVPGVALPAGTTVEFRPGGYHVMLMDLKQPMKAGDVVPLTLTFENAEGKRLNVEIEAPVRPLNAMPAAGGHSGHGGASGHKH
jgi:periplasmic copper chaperone A